MIRDLGANTRNLKEVEQRLMVAEKEISHWTENQVRRLGPEAAPKTREQDVAPPKDRMKTRTKKDRSKGPRMRKKRRKETFSPGSRTQ